MRSFPWDAVVEAIGEDGYPILDRTASASDLRDYLKRIMTDGVFLDTEDAFAVTPGEGMSIIVSPGACVIEGTPGEEPNTRELTLQAASSQDRIDTVVIRWNDNREVRAEDLYVKTGVASAVPVRPTLTRNETVKELGICDIYIPANTTTLTAQRITDTRLDIERCGMVSALIEIDTTTFFRQLQAQTQVAVDLAQSALDDTIVGELQNKITALQESLEALENKCPFEIGELYLTFDSTNPSTKWPDTTWQQQTGRFLRMANDTSTGGADSYKLTAAQLPAHAHTLQYYKYNRGGGTLSTIGWLGYSAGDDNPMQTVNTLNTGTGSAINNMPAYQDVYAWRRIS